MNEVKELKDVLDRIEGKMIAAGKMYTALNFAVWEGVMILYYLLISVLVLETWETALYWIIGFGAAMYVTLLLGKRLSVLERAVGEGKSHRGVGVLVGVAWGIGAFVGWGLVPALNLGVSMEASFTMGLLSFIAISVFGMWLTFTAHGIGAKEMVPSFIIPAAGIPVAMAMKSGAIWFGGFAIALGFTLTVIWYLYSAFRVIEG